MIKFQMPLALFLALVGFSLAPNCFAETATVTSVLSGLPDPLPKGISQQVRIIDVSSGASLSATKGKARKKFKTTTEAKPSLLMVNHFSKKKNLNRVGIAPLFKSGTIQAKGVRARIRMRSNTSPASIRASSSSASLAASGNASLVRVGVPENGFVVSGPGTNGRMAPGIASLVIVNIVQNAPCYSTSSGVVIIEVDPRSLDARRNEFELCSSGLADPSTCVADNYVAPDHSLRGSLTSDGSTATFTIEFVDTNGNVIATESESGSLSDALELIDRASKRIANRMCDGRISIENASCPSTACVCCDHAGCEGNKWEHVFKVSARGPVGSTVRLNFTAQYTNINCGDWTVGSCSPLPCCVREEGQPEQTILNAVMPFPWPIFNPACICPPHPVTPVSFLAQIVNGSHVQEQEQIVDCPG